MNGDEMSEFEGLSVIQNILRRLGLKGDLFYMNGRYYVVMKRGIAKISRDKRDINIVINIDGKNKVIIIRNLR
jgi:hypothetical protein